MTYKLHQGDCLEIMPTLEKGSVQMCFADLPYGVTEHGWDVRISLVEFWAGVAGACKSDAAQVLTATQPMASHLVVSNLKKFRYDLQWEKTSATGFLNAKKMPLRCHESVLVFYKALPTYNPQMTVAKRLQGASVRSSPLIGSSWGNKAGHAWVETGMRYPLSVVRVPSENKQKSLHPTQKPVALLEWLIATYTNPGDTVLDPCFGSATTGVACARLGRNFIGIEKDPTYFAAGKARLEAEHARLAEGAA